MDRAEEEGEDEIKDPEDVPFGSCQQVEMTGTDVTLYYVYVCTCAVYNTLRCRYYSLSNFCLSYAC